MDERRYEPSYNPSFDGLRAVAALSVMLYHFAVPGFRAGGFGVDVFFVLSGYLITLSLYRSSSQGHGLGVFFWHRLLRLMPALLFLCFVYAVTAKWLVPIEIVRNDILLSIFYVSDVTLASSLSFPMYLGNCWTLAVEEKFYLLWPVVMLLFTKPGKAKGLLLATLMLCVASILWRGWLSIHGASEQRINIGFDTRCDGLLLGCLLAITSIRPNMEKMQEKLAGIWPIAVLSIVILVVFGTASPSTFVIANVSSALILLALVHKPRSLISRALRAAPLAFVGRISYGVYLWNDPIYLLLHFHNVKPMAAALIGIPLTFVSATCSHFYIEQPAMRLRNIARVSSQRLGSITAILSVIAMIGSAAFFFQDSVRQEISPQRLEIEAYGPEELQQGTSYNVQPNGQSCMWIKLSHLVAQGSRVQIGSRTLVTTVHGDTVSAFLPTDLLNHPGTEKVTIVGPDGDPVAPSVTLQIVAD